MSNRTMIVLAILFGVFLAFSDRDESDALTYPSDVLFEFDEAELTEDGEEAVAEAAEILQERAVGTTVTVHGHTDAVGTAEYNQHLSEDRAATVAAALEDALDGVDITLESVGHGATEPVKPNEIGGWDNPLGRKQNRRVEVEIGTAEPEDAEEDESQLAES